MPKSIIRLPRRLLMLMLNTKYTIKSDIVNRYQDCDRYNEQTTEKYGTVMLFKALRSDALRDMHERREQMQLHISVAMPIAALQKALEHRTCPSAPFTSLSQIARDFHAFFKSMKYSPSVYISTCMRLGI